MIYCWAINSDHHQTRLMSCMFLSVTTGNNEVSQQFTALQDLETTPDTGGGKKVKRQTGNFGRRPLSLPSTMPVGWEPGGHNVSVRGVRWAKLKSIHDNGKCISAAAATARGEHGRAGL